MAYNFNPIGSFAYPDSNCYLQGFKSTYGNETVSEINSPSFLTLDGSNVTGDVNAASYINAEKTKAKTLNAVSYINAKDVTAESLSAGSYIVAINVEAKTLNAGSYVRVVDSSKLGSICAGTTVDVSRCTLTSVTAGAKAVVNHSEITGTLTCRSNNLVLNDSLIDTIDLKCENTGNIAFGGGKYNIQASHIGVVGHNATVTNNPSSGGSKFVLNCGSIGVVGNNLQVSNGSNGRFINGLPFEEFKARNANQPAAVNTRQVIELHNCEVKNVIFESEGEVILIGSKVTGIITNGKIKD